MTSLLVFSLINFLQWHQKHFLLRTILLAFKPSWQFTLKQSLGCIIRIKYRIYTWFRTSLKKFKVFDSIMINLDIELSLFINLYNIVWELYICKKWSWLEHQSVTALIYNESAIFCSVNVLLPLFCSKLLSFPMHKG